MDTNAGTPSQDRTKPWLKNEEGDSPPRICSWSMVRRHLNRVLQSRPDTAQGHPRQHGSSTKVSRCATQRKAEAEPTSHEQGRRDGVGAEPVMFRRTERGKRTQTDEQTGLTREAPLLGQLLLALGGLCRYLEIVRFQLRMKGKQVT